MSDGVDPAYLWNQFLGRTGPSKAICAKCGLGLVHESDWWQSLRGEVKCEAGDYHVPSRAPGCGCGHEQDAHWRGKGECMFSTDNEVWACGCHEYDGDNRG